MSRDGKIVTLPDRFTPMFWEDADQRFAIVREIKRRYEELKQDAGVNSTQKDLLAQRAVFVAVQLESMERAGVETGKFDPGVYGQLTNTLLGLLKALGLEKVAKPVSTDLKTYVNGRRSE